MHSHDVLSVVLDKSRNGIIIPASADRSEGMFDEKLAWLDVFQAGFTFSSPYLTEYSLENVKPGGLALRFAVFFSFFPKVVDLFIFQSSSTFPRFGGFFPNGSPGQTTLLDRFGSKFCVGPQSQSPDISHMSQNPI